MKKLFVAGIAAAALCGAPALAADIPTKAPVYKAPVAALFNWTGFYVGGHVGGGWGDKDWYDPGLFLSQNLKGFLGGVQSGFNWQSGPWVLGIEGQFSWTGIEDSGVILGGCCVFNSRIDWIATLAGRLGYASDRWLLYAKGGAAWARDKYNKVTEGPTARDNRSGWMVGGGLEYGLSNNWSAKIEYNYMDFGRHSVTFSDGEVEDGVDQRLHVVKVGINYRFGAAPVVAKY